MYLDVLLKYIICRTHKNLKVFQENTCILLLAFDRKIKTNKKKKNYSKFRQLKTTPLVPGVKPDRLVLFKESIKKKQKNRKKRENCKLKARNLIEKEII